MIIVVVFVAAGEVIFSMLAIGICCCDRLLPVVVVSSAMGVCCHCIWMSSFVLGSSSIRLIGDCIPVVKGRSYGIVAAGVESVFRRRDWMVVRISL